MTTTQQIKDSDSAGNKRLDLRVFRKRAGLTAAQAAERLGVNQATVSRHETEPEAVTLGRLRDYGRLYGVSLVDMLGGATPNPDSELCGEVVSTLCDALESERLVLDGAEMARVAKYLYGRGAGMRGPIEERGQRLRKIVGDLIRFAAQNSRPAR